MSPYSRNHTALMLAEKTNLTIMVRLHEVSRSGYA